MNVTALPLYNISDIPESLRQLANRIEHGEVDAEHVVVCIELKKTGKPTYVAFGAEPFTRAYAAGLCLAAANIVLMD